MSDHVITTDSNNRPTEVLLHRNRLVWVPNRSLVSPEFISGLINLISNWDIDKDDHRFLIDWVPKRFTGNF